MLTDTFNILSISTQTKWHTAALNILIVFTCESSVCDVEHKPWALCGFAVTFGHLLPLHSDLLYSILFTLHFLCDPIEKRKTCLNHVQFSYLFPTLKHKNEGLNSVVPSTLGAVFVNVCDRFYKQLWSNSFSFFTMQLYIIYKMRRKKE